MTTARFVSSVTLDLVRPSPTNPRKHFDEAKLAELTESVRQHGILQPLVVRRVGVDLEIVAGERRFRAAKAAGLLEVPVVLKDLDDKQVAEIQIVENCQRDDLTPLEEAEGYRVLRERHGYAVEQIAAKLGRSVKYVYDRMKLGALAGPAKKALEEQRITAGHAILLARLKPADQKRAIDSGVFQVEDVFSEPGEHPERACSVRELDTWIAENVRFDLKKDADPSLFPAAAAAVEQGAKLTPITYMSWTEEAAGCLRPLIANTEWKLADGAKGAKKCAVSTLGIVVLGRDRGSILTVCADRACNTHWPKAEKPAAPDPAIAQMRERARIRGQKDAADRERWVAALPALRAAIAARVEALPADATGALANAVIERFTPSRPPEGCPPRGKTAEDLVRHLAYVALDECVSREYRGPIDFPKVAKRIGIDLKAALRAAKPAAPKKKAKSA